MTATVAAPAVEFVPSQALAVGDVVHCYGSRIKLVELRQGGPGHVENARKYVNADYEIARIGEAEWIKREESFRAFCGENLGPVYKGATQSFFGDWAVQGNCYATWAREV